MQSPHKEEHLSTKEAAAELGVAPGVVRRLVRQGALPVIQYGERGRFRFRQEDLHRLLQPKLLGGRGGANTS